MFVILLIEIAFAMGTILTHKTTTGVPTQQLKHYSNTCPGHRDKLLATKGFTRLMHIMMTAMLEAGTWDFSQLTRTFAGTTLGTAPPYTLVRIPTGIVVVTNALRNVTTTLTGILPHGGTLLC
jgi:hypothetical protein